MTDTSTSKKLPEPESLSQKDQLRATIFAAKKRKRKVIKVFGAEIELVQPTVGELLDLQELKTTKERVMHSLISYCYVPGTNEKLFFKGDADALLEMPFSEDYTKVQEAIAELTGVNIEEQEGNSEEVLLTITS